MYFVNDMAEEVCTEANLNYTKRILKDAGWRVSSQSMMPDGKWRLICIREDSLNF